MDAINMALRKLAALGLGCEVHVNHYRTINVVIAAATGVDAPHTMSVLEDWTCSGCTAAWDATITRCKWCGVAKHD